MLAPNGAVSDDGISANSWRAATSPAVLGRLGVVPVPVVMMGPLSSVWTITAFGGDCPHTSRPGSSASEQQGMRHRWEAREVTVPSGVELDALVEGLVHGPVRGEVDAGARTRTPSKDGHDRPFPALLGIG